MNIEEVAHDTPEKIVILTSIRRPAIQPFHGRKIAFALGLEGDPGEAMRQADRRSLRGVHAKDMACSRSIRWS